MKKVHYCWPAFWFVIRTSSGEPLFMSAVSAKKKEPPNATNAKQKTKNKKRKKGKETVLRSRERSEDPRYQNHAIYEL